MPDQPRPVWLTDADMATSLDSAFREIVRAKRDAAPADPTEAVINAMNPYGHQKDPYGHLAPAVLRALGMPDA